MPGEINEQPGIPRFDDSDTYQQYTDAQREERKAKHKRKRRRRCRRGLRLTSEVALVVLTFGVIAVTWRQAVIMAEQNRILTQQTGLMNGALIETQKSNELTRKSVESTVRAWIVPRLPSDVSWASSPDGERWGLKFVGAKVDNVGQLLALNLRARTDWAWSIAELPQHVAGPATGAIVPPHAKDNPWLELRRERWIFVNRLTKDAVTAGTRKLYVGGVIIYDDPTGKGRKTKWCAVYAPLTRDFLFCDTGIELL